MSERAGGLAGQFKQASDGFLAKVAGLTDSQWNQPLSDDPRAAGVVAHHVASGYVATIGVLQGLLAGMDLGLTWDMIHGGNAAHAAENKDIGRDETLAALKANGAMAHGVLSSLSDAQLDQPVLFPMFGEGPMPAQAVIEGLVIGHIGMHAGDFH